MTTQVETQTITIFSLIQKLSQSEVIHLNQGETLKISEFDMSDFIDLANEPDPIKKLTLIQKHFFGFNLVLNLEGSLAVGNLNLDDRSWMIGASEGGELKISANPIALKKSVDDVVKFLKNLELGHGLVLKAGQDLLLEGFSKDAVQGYFELSAKNSDAKVLENIQDEFFIASSQTLKDDNLVLKVFAVDATNLNREVNPELGMVIFKPISEDVSKKARVVLALGKKA